MWRSERKQVWVGPAKADMAAKVFESIGKFGLALAVAGGVVNSALCNMDAGHWAVIFDGFGGVQDIVIEDSLPHPLGTETNYLWLPLLTM